MREILFRGRCTGSGEWIYGNLNFYPDINRAFIRLWPGENKRTDTLETEVYKESVGQYTGICDKNGRKIFEGDIIKCSIIYDIGCYPHSETEIKEVKYIEGCFMPLYDCERNTYEVIGNIYDNPDLIK